MDIQRLNGWFPSMIYFLEVILGEIKSFIRIIKMYFYSQLIT